jgi:hypothetical protein
MPTPDQHELLAAKKAALLAKYKFASAKTPSEIHFGAGSNDSGED